MPFCPIGFHRVDFSQPGLDALGVLLRREKYNHLLWTRDWLFALRKELGKYRLVAELAFIPHSSWDVLAMTEKSFRWSGDCPTTTYLGIRIEPWDRDYIMMLTEERFGRYVTSNGDIPVDNLPPPEAVELY